MEIVETQEFGAWKAVKINLPNAPFLLITAGKGFVMCGYLNMEAAEKLGDAACMVTGVKDFQTMLKAKIVKVSSKAGLLGAKEGISCEEALKLFS